MRTFCALLILVLLNLAVFAQVHDHQFVTFDDGGYVFFNPFVRSGLTWNNVWRALTTPELANWHPVTTISWMVDVELFGTPPAGAVHAAAPDEFRCGGYVLMNVALRTVAAGVLFRLLYSVSANWLLSLGIAALFSIHPLNVESAAWVTERKGNLSTLFGFLSLAAYVRFTRVRGARWYLASLAAFVLSLLSKQMLVTLPFLLLLLDYWPLGRTTFGPRPTCVGENVSLPPGRLLGEKIPFFALTLAFCLLAFTTQRQDGAVASLERLPLQVRFLSVPVGYVLYLQKVIWPAGLSVFYPHPAGAVTALEAGSCALLLGAICLAAFWQRKSRPWLFVGWFWFFGTMSPVSGLVQTGSHHIADRYAQVPTVGLFVALLWTLDELIGQFPRGVRRVSAATGAVAVLALAAIAWVQTGYWQDGRELFAHALRVTRNNAIAHTNFAAGVRRSADYKNSQGLWREAFSDYVLAAKHLKRATELVDDMDAAHRALGGVSSELGLLSLRLGDESQADAWLRLAELHLGQAFTKGDEDSTVLMKLAEISALRHDYNRELRLYQQLVERDDQLIQREPVNSEAYYRQGLVKHRMSERFRELGQRDKADQLVEECLRALERSVQLDPTSYGAQVNLGNTYLELGRPEEAAAHFRTAISLTPSVSIAYINLALAQEELQQIDAAIETLRNGLVQAPADVTLRYRLGDILARTGRTEEAISQLQQVLRLNPNFAAAAQLLAEIRSK